VHLAHTAARERAYRHRPNTTDVVVRHVRGGYCVKQQTIEEDGHSAAGISCLSFLFDRRAIGMVVVVCLSVCPFVLL